MNILTVDTLNTGWVLDVLDEELEKKNGALDRNVQILDALTTRIRLDCFLVIQLEELHLAHQKHFIALENLFLPADRIDHSDLDHLGIVPLS